MYGIRVCGCGNSRLRLLLRGRPVNGEDPSSDVEERRTQPHGTQFVSLPSTNIHQITSQEIGATSPTKTIKVTERERGSCEMTHYNILISCVSLSRRSRDPVPHDQLSRP